MLNSNLSKVSALIGAAVLGGAAVFAISLSDGHQAGSSQAKTSASIGGMSGDASAKSKQLWTCGMHPQVIQDHPGTCPICHMKLTPLKDDSDAGAGETVAGKRKILYYWDPMLGPSSIAHAPGKSAMNMDLVPVYEEDQSGGPTVKIDPTIVQNMGVRTAAVTRGPLTVTVRTFGMLEAPESSVYEVNLKVNGWIQKLYANTEGMHVLKGEPLFDLYSPDLQVAEEELIGAVKVLNGVDPKSTGTMCDESQGMVDSAKQKLRLWGISDQDIDAIAAAKKAPTTIAFRSPASGDLVEKMVVEGSAVQAGMKLMRIEDHSTLWLNAQVYEQQIPSVALGQTVDAMVDGLPGKTFTGPIMFIHPHVDHMTRTVTVRIAISNPKHELHPGMYATANIVTKPLADAVLVPRESVIDTGTRQIAFVAQAEGHFDPRKVRMGLAGDDDQVEILEGLAPGETVVTSGQFLMDVESRTTEAIDKLRHASTPGSDVPMSQSDIGAMTPATMPIAATAPVPSAHSLVIAHCPMKNADWIQTGDEISNPYFGSMMATCGSVTKKVVAPMEGTPLDAVTDNYLMVGKSFDADKLDAIVIQALKAAADKLPAETFTNLQRSIGALAEAKDVDTGRKAFQSVSGELIRVLDIPAK